MESYKFRTTYDRKKNLTEMGINLNGLKEQVMTPNMSQNKELLDTERTYEERKEMLKQKYELIEMINRAERNVLYHL